MNTHRLNRRQFAARCTALGLSLPAATMFAAGARAQDAGADSNPAPRTVSFPDGTVVPALGQGSWHLGQGRHPYAAEEDAMRTGIALGMSLIDTSRNYGEGRSESLIGRVIAGQRDRVFLVSKVQADEIVAGDRIIEGGFARAFAGSLTRLGTDHLDLYLLHSPVPKRHLSAVIAEFEHLRAAGKIRAWGVSNFNVEQMEELFRVPDGHRCATNQVRYSLSNQYFQHDVLPWCAEHKMPVMAASPLGGLDYAHTLLADRQLAGIGAMHGVSASAAALGWAMRSGNVIAIPESGNPAHVTENAVAASIRWIPPDA
ncbi:MAG TPA: aldo/keto reductase [Micropepsaceae bacterium]|nr:aldo/keto reductase [Micropepsaceae bacterium]